ncbi:hypothetical protein AB4068_15465 [Arthrobacter sp. 2RAF22]|uniref:hypothetical protein n=1 Tax=Arthrobacter sp. 2RAF22 TaxID=3232996 RepID=UPI003F904CB2
MEAVSGGRDRVLRWHFTEWAEQFDVCPSGSGYADRSGNSAFPAHAVARPGGGVWLSALGDFDEAGIRGHIEENELFQSVFIQTVKLTSNHVRTAYFDINGTLYRTIFQNTRPGRGNPIIDVLFISEGESSSEPVRPWSISASRNGSLTGMTGRRVQDAPGD